jgi:hypothetical protein
MSEAGTTVRAKDGKDGKENKLDVALHCPWCGIVSRTTSGIFHQAETRRGRECYAVAICQVRECNRAVFLIIGAPADFIFSRADMPFEAKVYPAAEAQYEPDGVPKEIAKEFCEALECHWNGHNLGAALVGRRVLQAAARDVLGGKLTRLELEIAAIPDDKLNKALKDQATHVRLIGNDAAHVEPVDPDDVRDLIDFVEEVLDVLYVRPKRVAELQKKRDAANQAKAAAKAKAAAPAKVMKTPAPATPAGPAAAPSAPNPVPKT